MAKRWAWTLLTGLALSGCAGSDEVLFVTNTNIGLNLDSKPPAMSIAYDRADGYIGPVYGNGALPPVAARLQSDLDVFNPVIRQVYATGDAALIVTDREKKKSARQLLSKSKRAAYFLTSSTLGLKVTFAGSVPDSINFGYKRKEMSFIPIGTSASADCYGAAGSGEVDCYGSALATIDIGGHIADATDSRIKLSQFFATGEAAENLAADHEVRDIMRSRLYQSSVVLKYKNDEYTQKIQAWLDTNSADDPKFKQNCMEPRKLTLTLDLLYDAQYQDLRQSCVQALGL